MKFILILSKLTLAKKQLHFHIHAPSLNYQCNYMHIKFHFSDFVHIKVITADDRNEEARAKARQDDLLKYLVGTLTSVAIFSFIAYCFIKDPKGCIHAFGLGCPCCIVCLPCIRK